MEIMYALEPIHTCSNTILFNELEEVDEVLFFTKGIHDIGYELNTEKIFVLRYENSNPLGAYNVTFDERSEYIYKTHTDCDGFFIRRNKWKVLLST